MPLIYIFPLEGITSWVVRGNYCMSPRESWIYFRCIQLFLLLYLFLVYFLLSLLPLISLLCTFSIRMRDWDKAAVATCVHSIQLLEEWEQRNLPCCQSLICRSKRSNTAALSSPWSAVWVVLVLVAVWRLARKLGSSWGGGTSTPEARGWVFSSPSMLEEKRVSGWGL